MVVSARLEDLEPVPGDDGAEHAVLRLECTFKADRNITGDVIKIYQVRLVPFTDNSSA